MKIFWFLKTIIFVKPYHDYFSKKNHIMIIFPQKNHIMIILLKKKHHMFFLIALTKTISCFFFPNVKIMIWF